MKRWGAPTVKVRHWPHGYQHDHVGIDAEDALAHAFDCAGHQYTERSIKMSAAMMKANDNRLEYVPTGRNPEIFRLVHRGKDW